MMNEKMRKKRKNVDFLTILTAFAMLFTAMAGLVAAQAQKQVYTPIQHTVTVSGKIVPLYAVDAKGQPVFDLKKEEIRLLVNGKETPVGSLKGYDMSDPKDAPAANLRGRVIFFIFDSVANTVPGLKRARQIAIRLIEKSAPRDAFIVLESNPQMGIRYVIGPERDKVKLVKAIKKIKQIANLDRQRRRIGSASANAASTYSRGEDESSMTSRIRELKALSVTSGSSAYKQNQKVFNQTLNQLKFALKSITFPKTVYLFSGGLPMGEYSNIYDAALASAHEMAVTGYYADMLKAMAKSLNLGGSMLYIVNPDLAAIEGNSDSNLKLLAQEGGGKYFRGMDVETVSKKLLNSSTAYYELGFSLTAKQNEKVGIRMESTRKGVTINTVICSEQDLPYAKMADVQKKFFAMNVAQGGSWSRMVATVETVKLKKKPAAGGILAREVLIPKHMRGKEADVFMVSIDPKTGKAKVGFSKKVVNEKETFSFSKNGKLQQFLVLIEPNTTHCLFSAVK